MGKRILLLTINKSHVSYYFASEAFTTLSSDSVPDQMFEPRIFNDPTFEKTAGLRLWGNGKSVSSIGYFDLIATGGDIDYLITSQVFGNAVTAEIAILYDSLSYDSRVVIASNVVVDKVEAQGEAIMRVTLRDTSVVFDKALTTATYSVAGNTALNGTQRPITLGAPVQHPVIKVDGVTLQFDIMDNQYWEAALVTNMYSRGVVATFGTDYKISNVTGTFGYEYLVSITGGDPFTCDFAGAVIVGASIIDGTNGGDFTAWAGGLPTGWTLINGPMTGGVHEFAQSGTSCLCRSNSSKLIALDKSAITIPVSSLIHYAFDITAFTTGGDIVIKLMNGVTLVSSQTKTITSTGHAYGMFSVTATAGQHIQIQIGSTNCLFTIDNFRLVSVTNTRVPLRMVQYVSSRIGFSGTIDTAAWNALPQDQIGMYVKGDATGADVLDAIANSYSAAWWVSSVNGLTVKRLYDPTTGSSVATISDNNIVAGQDLQFELDLAPGLSDTVAYNKNWQVLGDNDLAGAVTQANRALYGSEYRLTGQTTAFIPTFYSDAIGAPPVPTILSAMTTAANAHLVHPNLIAGLYSVVRAFKTVNCVVSDSTYLTMEPLDRVDVDLSRFSLSGTTGIIASVKGSYLSDTCVIRFWS